MRRNVIALLGVLLLLVVGMIPAAAHQEATPESGLADLGLPELNVTVTGTGFEGIPETLDAGRYLVTVTAAEETGEFGGGVALLQPVGVTADAFLAAIAGPPGGPDAVPAEGTPTEGEAEDAGGPPPFLFESVYAGGAYAEPGQTVEVILDLGPGTWIAWGDDPEAVQEPIVFEVTGELPADLAEPETSATISMAEYVIEVTDGALVSGPQVVRIDNVGAQPHFIGWGKVPDGTTAEQIEVVLAEDTEAEMTGTPPVYSDFNPDEDFVPVTFTATQSTSTSIWISVDLEAGSYGLICFFPDQGDGMPHANHGMYTIIEVTE